MARGEASTSTIDKYANDVYNYIATTQNISVRDLNTAPSITSNSIFDDSKTDIKLIRSC